MCYLSRFVHALGVIPRSRRDTDSIWLVSWSVWWLIKSASHRASIKNFGLALISYSRKDNRTLAQVYFWRNQLYRIISIHYYNYYKLQCDLDISAGYHTLIMGRSTNFISRDKVLEFDLEKFKRYCYSRKTVFYILNPKSVKSGFCLAEFCNFTFEVTWRSLWGRFQPIYGLPSTKRPTKMVTKAWKWNWERYIGNELNLDSKMFQKLSKFKFCWYYIERITLN